MKIETIAEYIIDQRVFDRARDMGFDLGQGAFFGAPMSDLPPPPLAPAAAARRQGIRESWG